MNLTNAERVVLRAYAVTNYHEYLNSQLEVEYKKLSIKERVSILCGLVGKELLSPSHKVTLLGHKVLNGNVNGNVVRVITRRREP